MQINFVAPLVFNAVEGLAVILTVFRLGFRLKIRRFWWEDAWAAFASLCSLASIISSLIFLTASDHKSALIAGWINDYMFTCVVWSVRMSLVVSLVRITSSTMWHRITLTLAAFIVFIWVITLGLQTWWCAGRSKTWSGDPRPYCTLPRSIVIFQVSTNCTTDAATLILSLKSLWGVKLPQRQRRMILSLFTASRFLCAFSLAHSISQLVGVRSVEEILAEVQLVGFLVVCNLLVVVTYMFRAFLSSSDEDLTGDDDFTTPRFKSTENLTTVDLDYDRTPSELGSGSCSSPAPSTA